jgi:hypothetical protein
VKFSNPAIAKTVLAIGLLTTTLPTVTKDLIPIPDFVSGLVLGLGLGLQITGLILLRRRNNSASEI